MPPAQARTTRLLSLLPLLLLAACASLDRSSPRPSDTSPANATVDDGVLWPRPSDRIAPAWPDAAVQQLVVVLTPGWNAPAGRLARFEREPGGAWQAVGDSVEVSVGREGSAWGLGLHPPQTTGPIKREGDGRAPAGIFALGPAFGAAPQQATRLAYLPMQRDHWCIDVPGSPLYNQIVDARLTGAEAIEGSTEPMRRDLHKQGDNRYAQGFVVAHNTPGVDRAGSCIFAHLWKAPGEPTAGCTAMAEPAMAALLGWLDPAKSPRFVLLPVQEYARLQGEWGLPAPAAARASAHADAGPAGATPDARDLHE